METLTDKERIGSVNCDDDQAQDILHLFEKMSELCEMKKYIYYELQSDELHMSSIDYGFKVEHTKLSDLEFQTKIVMFRHVWWDIMHCVSRRMY